jgi:hypothetical protein
MRMTERFYSGVQNWQKIGVAMIDRKGKLATASCHSEPARSGGEEPAFPQ